MSPQSNVDGREASTADTHVSLPSATEEESGVVVLPVSKSPSFFRTLFESSKVPIMLANGDIAFQVAASALDVSGAKNVAELVADLKYGPVYAAAAAVGATTTELLLDMMGCCQPEPDATSEAELNPHDLKYYSKNSLLTFVQALPWTFIFDGVRLGLNANSYPFYSFCLVAMALMAKSGLINMVGKKLGVELPAGYITKDALSDVAFAMSVYLGLIHSGEGVRNVAGVGQTQYSFVLLTTLATAIDTKLGVSDKISRCSSWVWRCLTSCCQSKATPQGTSTPLLADAVSSTSHRLGGDGEV